MGVPDASSSLLVDGLGLQLVAEVPLSAARPRATAPAGVHPSYLARRFRDHFGESIGRYIRQLRLTYAAQQIALSAGFADQSHFAHVFRREMGVSPGAFRRLSSGRPRSL